MMIITCVNCVKKFDVDSSLIPEKGRLLQCSGCDHKWFFKKEIINEPITPIKISEPTEEIGLFNKESDSLEIQSPKNIELLDRQNNDDSAIGKNLVNNNKNNNKDIEPKINFSKNKKNYNILSFTIVFIISFIALIIVLDTFQGPISKIFKNIEFLLYNLYETINDIKLFLTDLI